MSDWPAYAKGCRAVSLMLLALAPLTVLILLETFSRQFDRDIKHRRVDPQIIGLARAR